MYLHLETPKLQEVFLSKTLLILLWRDTCISSPQPNRPICANRAYIHLKTVIWRKYLLQTLIQFSLGNNDLDATASNRDGCLWRDSCLSSNQLNRPIWNKMTLSPP
jgi:hypothetical protein